MLVVLVTVSLPELACLRQFEGSVGRAILVRPDVELRAGLDPKGLS